MRLISHRSGNGGGCGEPADFEPVEANVLIHSEMVAWPRPISTEAYIVKC